MREFKTMDEVWAEMLIQVQSIESAVWVIAGVICLAFIFGGGRFSR